MEQWIMDKFHHSQNKLTMQRQALIKYIQMHPHVTADQCVDSLIKLKSKVSIATVYRNLNLFEELGIIDKFWLKGNAYYEMRNNSRIHMLCASCGRVEEIDYPVNKSMVDLLQKDHKITVRDVKVEVDGICKSCNGSIKYE